MIRIRYVESKDLDWLQAHERHSVNAAIIVTIVRTAFLPSKREPVCFRLALHSEVSALFWVQMSSRAPICLSAFLWNWQGKIPITSLRWR